MILGIVLETGGETVTKILIVEDDKDLTSVVREWLEAQNFTLDVVHDGAEGYEFLKSGAYDLAILDWELPSLSGIEILRKHRLSNGLTPILMLTGKDQVADKETGLDTGADDYLTKPFNMRELAARVRALARRPAAILSDVLKFADLEMDTKKHLLFKGGKEVHLLPKDFALLEFLMKHPGEIFSSDTLLLRVWNMDSEATGEAVRTSIKRIRQIVDAGQSEERSMIETLRRVGYRLRVPKD